MCSQVQLSAPCRVRQRAPPLRAMDAAATGSAGWPKLAPPQAPSHGDGANAPPAPPPKAPTGPAPAPIVPPEAFGVIWADNGADLANRPPPPKLARPKKAPPPLQSKPSAPAPLPQPAMFQVPPVHELQPALEWKFPGRVKLVNSLSGQQLCWPGPATAANEWTIPDKHLVESLLGLEVFLVDDQAKDKLLTDEAGEKVWRK